jgi:transglutaminase-like putative cysteine protease
VITYRIRHATVYGYDSEVSSSYGEVHLLPRDLPNQRCRESSLTVDPHPAGMRHRTDFFGNRAAFFSVLDPHTTLSVTADSVVEVRPAAAPAAGTPWEQAGRRAAADAEAAQFLLDSPMVPAGPELAALAAPLFAPDRPLLDAVAELSTMIHRDFAYLPGATSVRSTIAEILAARAGVCQDFAHLMIGCLRSLGLAARYVSGYLETDPPPGQPRLEGADASHAWVSVWVPGLDGSGGWVDVDPTNDQFVGERHITIGWGRDYQDLPPVKGVIFTDGKRHELTVRVDVIRQP